MALTRAVGRGERGNECAVFMAGDWHIALSYLRGVQKIFICVSFCSAYFKSLFFVNIFLKS